VYQSLGAIQRTYNKAPHSTTATVNTGISKETMTMSIANNSITNAGTQAVTASCSSVTGGQGKCTNYSISDTTNTLTINPKQLDQSNLLQDLLQKHMMEIQQVILH